MIEEIKYYIERSYPYLFALIVSIGMISTGINFVNDSNLNNALDGVNTVAALILGFLGAMLPVILGMKNESKMVKYVFEKDSKKLFLKYIKATIMNGLILVSLTVLLYFRKSIHDNAKITCFYLWVFFLVLFFMCTYRCLSNMLSLVFTKDSDLQKNYGMENDEKKKIEEKKLEEKYKL